MKVALALVTALIPTISSVDEERPITLNQFVKLVRGLHSEVTSISLYYEGELSFTGPTKLLEWRSPNINERFQGFYVFRTDGSTLCDIYTRGVKNEVPFSRTVYTLFNRKLNTISYVPDEKFTRIQPRIATGYPGALSGVNCPERLSFHWLFNAMEESGDLPDVGRFAYEFLGWETIDGSKCLKITLNTASSRKKRDPWTQTYWIDLRRGANVLKYELYVGDKLFARLHDVELEEFTTQDNKRLWLPISGTRSSYRWEDEYFSSAIFKEKILVVRTSVQVNKIFHDSFFDIRRYLKSTTSSRVIANMTLMKEFHQPVSRVARTDPQSVNERLDEVLMAADRQVDQLRLSASPADAPSFSVIQVLYGILAISICSIFIIYVRRLRKY